VPDATDTFLTTGAGSGTTESAARFDGTTTTGIIAICYRVNGGSATLTFDLTELNQVASVRVRKFDPTNGAYTTINTYATTGSQSIGSLGNNSAGDADWLLVFDVNSGAGSSTVSYSYTQVATGKRTPKASGSTAYTYTAAAAGTHTSRGTATAAYTYTQTATGKRTPKAAGATAYTYTLTAQGQGPVVGQSQGSAAVTYTYTVATAAGVRTPKGTAVPGTMWTAVATGTRPSYAASFVTHTWELTAFSPNVAPVILGALYAVILNPHYRATILNPEV
jgi:hypothetical protein